MRRVGLLFAVCSILPAQGPDREVYTEAVFSGPLPGLCNNRLYFIDHPDRVRLFSPDGHFATSFDVQDALGKPAASVASIAIDSDGTIAVGWGTGGRIAGERMEGIQIRDAAGMLLRTIDTGLFVPGNLAFAADHSLWSFGWQQDTERPGYPAKDFLTLRHFSSGGNKMGSYLPRSLFPPGLEPGLAQAQERRIFVMPDFIGLVAFSGNVGTKQEWVEVDMSGNVRGRWRLDDEKFPGVALTSDGHIYATQRDRKIHKDITVRLDRATSTWQPVTTAAKGLLYGADGDQLIFGSWPTGGMVLHWFKQPS